MRTKKRSLYAAQARVNWVEGKELWRSICESIDRGAQPPAYISRLSAVEERTERTIVMTNPHTAATAATGSATLKVKVMSGWLWLMAPAMRRTKQRNATEVKKEMTPVTKPIAELRKKVRIKPISTAGAALS